MSEYARDHTIRVYVQIGNRKLQCVGESEGPAYKWIGTSFLDGWAGPTGQIVLEFERKGRKK